MTQVLFRNLQLLEPGHGELRGGYELLVENDRVRECADGPIKSSSAEVVDCGGRTLMPGLIDAHVHVIHSEVNIRFMEAMPLTCSLRGPRRGCGPCSTAASRRCATPADATGASRWAWSRAIWSDHGCS